MGWVSPEGHCRHPRMGLTIEVPDLADVGADGFHRAKRKPLVGIVRPLGLAAFNAAQVFAGSAVLNKECFTREPFR